MKLLRALLIPFFIIVGLLFLAGVVGAVGNRGADGIRQPIQFNHLLHTQELELECVACHQYVTTEEFAGRPQMATCTACHEDPQGDTAEEALLIEYVKSGEEVPWRRIYDVPSHVYYSHRRHVTVAKIGCSECHGEIGTSTSPPKKPLNVLSMKFCITCHEKQGASTDCNSCHR